VSLAPQDPAVDALGTRHPRAGREARIVSLVPSITELLFALDLGPQVVGRTGFCIHPREALREVAKVGGTKDVDLARLRALAPTHVIVNIDENTRDTVDALRAFVPHVLVTHPNAPADNAALFRLIGAVFSREAQAESLCRQLIAELAACEALRVALPAERVLYLCWKEPWMSVAADTYIGGALGCVGWQVLHPAGGFAGAARYPAVELAQWLLRADRVLLSTEPYPFTQAHVDEMRKLHARVHLVDAEMTSWYGSRAIEGLRWLREFRRGH
jgi:ABC-type Fe3+-hydroxamate transport system substrate-binding protein